MQQIDMEQLLKGKLILQYADRKRDQGWEQHGQVSMACGKLQGENQ